MQANHWLPLTEYALRSGMSISTLRRKIKANAIAYRMEEGRYLIPWDEFDDSVTGFASSDSSLSSHTISQTSATPPAPRLVAPALPEARAIPAARPSPVAATVAPPSAAVRSSVEEAPMAAEELSALRLLMDRALEENALRWRALEARVAGLAKKVDLYSEHMGELKMLVKLFEEKLDRRA